MHLTGQINWKIDGFLAWASSRDLGSGTFSPEFKFEFPEGGFTFQISVKPKGQSGKKETKEEVGFFIYNRNDEELNIKATFSLLGSGGARFNEWSFTNTLAAKAGLGIHKLTTLAELAANQQTKLPGGHLQLRVDFTIYLHDPGSAAPRRTWAPRESLQDSMGRLMRDSDTSDFKIVCGDEAFPCHQNIMANKSDVLKQMMASRKWKENEERSLKIDDFPPEAVKQMIFFFYTNEFPPDANCTIRFFFKFKSLLSDPDKQVYLKMQQFCLTLFYSFYFSNRPDFPLLVGYNFRFISVLFNYEIN